MDGDAALTGAVFGLAALAAAAFVLWIVRSNRARAGAVAALVASRGWSVTRGQDAGGRIATTYADPAGGWTMTATVHRRQGGPALDHAGTRWETGRRRAPQGTWAVLPFPPGGTAALGAVMDAFDGPMGQSLLSTMLGGARIAPGIRPVEAPAGAARGFLLLADAAVPAGFDFAALDRLLAAHKPFAGVFADAQGVTLRIGETLDSAPALAAFADLGERIAALFPPRAPGDAAGGAS